jgi:hypothetical protein
LAKRTQRTKTLRLPDLRSEFASQTRRAGTPPPPRRPPATTISPYSSIHSPLIDRGSCSRNSICHGDPVAAQGMGCSGMRIAGCCRPSRACGGLHRSWSQVVRWRLTPGLRRRCGCSGRHRLDSRARCRLSSRCPCSGPRAVASSSGLFCRPPHWRSSSPPASWLGRRSPCCSGPATGHSSRRIRSIPTASPPPSLPSTRTAPLTAGRATSRSAPPVTAMGRPYRWKTRSSSRPQPIFRAGCRP